MSVTYWSMVMLALGGCIGSFLNVVIYRWSRDMSVQRPARSFCPHCEKPIAWYDNLPVISYLLLGGRCRQCRTPISLQYPAVEAATALVFLIAYDAFFVSCERFGVGQAGAIDAVMLVAHLALWSGLIVLTVMDLESYMVDINVTWIVAALGVLGHAFWTPAESFAADGWIRPGATTSAMALAACAGLIASMFLFASRPEFEIPDAPDPDEETAEPQPSPSSSTARHALPTLFIFLLAGYIAWLALGGVNPPLEDRLPPPINQLAFEAASPPAEPIDPKMWRIGGFFAILFLGLAIAASQPHVEADEEIVEAINSEAVHARRMVLQEFMQLAPALALMIAVLVIFRFLPICSEQMSSLLDWSPVGSWRPLAGLSTGLWGWLIGGTIGWSMRIGFTLLFGREAFGTGDIHILAAAGAVAGWPVALLGMFLASLLSLLALIIIRLRRQSRMLPFGPWLAMGFFLAAIFQDRILLFLKIRDFFSP